jgi:tetratricopeptide (TPR) repeat protein
MRPRSLRFLGRASVLAALVAAPRPALAETSSSEKKLAKEMLAEAIVDEKAGKCADALEVLRQVIQIQESGEALLHLGECMSKTGKLVDALKTWEHAEDVARNDKDRATQQALLPKLAALRERIPAVALQIPAEAKAVAIKIDGQVVVASRARVPISLDPGEHAIDAQAEGRAPFSAKITLAEKESKVVAVELPSLTGSSSSAGRSGGVPLGSWIAGGVGVALAVGGVVAFASAGSAASDGAEQCAKKASCDPAAVQTVQKLDAAALGLWIGAGVSLGLGVTLFALDRRAPAPASSARRPSLPSASARLVVAPSSIGLAGTF